LALFPDLKQIRLLTPLFVVFTAKEDMVQVLEKLSSTELSAQLRVTFLTLSTFEAVRNRISHKLLSQHEAILVVQRLRKILKASTLVRYELESKFCLDGPIYIGASRDLFRAFHRDSLKVYAAKVVLQGDHPDAEFDACNALHKLAPRFCPRMVSKTTIDDRVVLVMDPMFPGTLLDDIGAASLPLPSPIIRLVVLCVLVPLHFLHTKVGLVFGDIKPANIALTNDGMCALIDFGSAQNLNHATVVLSCTPPYPVQQTQANPRFDLVCLAWTIRCMLCGVDDLDRVHQANDLLAPVKGKDSAFGLAAIQALLTASSALDAFQAIYRIPCPGSNSKIAAELQKEILIGKRSFWW
jgi:serine/threonine protein kinase